MGLAEPPALIGPLQERHRLASVLDARHRPGPEVLQGEEEVGLAHGGRVPAVTGAVYGYDLEVFLGLRRFVHHRQREEMQLEFQLLESD